MTDWALLWRQIVEQRARRRDGDAGDDRWVGRAREFDERFRQLRGGPASHHAFVGGLLEPGTTLADIGAGTGSWSIPLARRVAWVTALDASPSMLAVLREHLAADAIANVEVRAGHWPTVSVEPHTYSLCSHAMYGDPDLPTFVTRMIRVTQRTCFLVLRTPRVGGILADAASHLWGQPFDRPNALIAYNVLLGMGLTPNVRIEPGRLREPATSPTLEAALAQIKGHFGLEQTDEHDGFLLDLLDRRLERRDGQYVWEPDLRSSLIYWDVARS